MTYDISVIIPMYNAADFIEHTLRSIEQQGFLGTIEVICVDDCSTDDTVAKVATFSKRSSLPITLLRQKENKRQGAARNRGLDEARGTYTFFLDSDDFLDEHTFETLFHKAETGSYDFVLCDWTFYYEETGERYVNNDLFMTETDLLGKNCERLYESRYYFSVNKLYNTAFLRANRIRFGEGYIYEDFEFYVNVVQQADQIGIVNNPFYKVRVNEQSVTKTNYTTDVHMRDFLTAVENSLVLFEPRHEQSYYMVYKYFFERCLLYADRRVPHQFKKEMIERTVQLLNEKETDFYVPRHIVLENQLYFGRGLIQQEKTWLIMFVDLLSRRKWLRRMYRIYKPFKNAFSVRRWVHRLKTSKLNKRRRIRAMNKIKRRSLEAPLQKKVLFLGFDYRYMGNSKYLYDFMTEHHPDIDVQMVTNDERVPAKHRVKPRSAHFWQALGEASVLMTESWTPLAFYKKEGALWIQLWHGTPYKKMFFDSHEKYIAKHNRNHKRHKKQDIEKWDVLIADSIGAIDLFSSAFSKQRDEIVPVGYPRVQWLMEQDKNGNLKQDIREKLSIRPRQTVLLYAPTWRDYNFKNPNPDMNYVLDIGALMKALGEDYLLITKMHSMEKGTIVQPNIVSAPPEMETQELLLITDTVISDYSSIIFDVLPLGKKIALYTNDRNRFDQARGTYTAIDEMLAPFTFEHVDDLQRFIQTPLNRAQEERYTKLREKFGNTFGENSNSAIVELIEDHLGK